MSDQNPIDHQLTGLFQVMDSAPLGDDPGYDMEAGLTRLTAWMSDDPAARAARDERERAQRSAKSRKQELVEEAERLSESDDWGPTAGRYKDLMIEWKAAGRAPKDADDTLWQRFRAAQDAFFARRSSVFDERDAEFADNARKKEELLAEAEKITTTDLDAARTALHRVQERWEEIGKVPRERIRELEGRLRAVEDKVRTAADAQWRRTDPEAEARAAQFRERVQQFETQAAKARAAGDKRRADQAEAQAAQWREWLAAAELLDDRTTSGGPSNATC